MRTSAVIRGRKGIVHAQARPYDHPTVPAVKVSANLMVSGWNIDRGGRPRLGNVRLSRSYPLGLFQWP